MFRDSHYRMHFETLYGYAPTREEWLEEQREHAAAGLLTMLDEGEKSRVPWHAKWDIRRNGSWHYSDEWVPSNSWTCRKIIRPSYDRATAVYLVVCVTAGSSFGRAGKARPNRWTAHLSFGEGDHYLGQPNFGAPRSCNSIISACRKAEKLPLDAAVGPLLKTVYTSRGASSVFRKEGAEFIPFKTCFYFDHDIGAWDEDPYFQTRWDTPYHGANKGRARVVGTYIETRLGGYNSGSYHEPTVPGGPLNYADMTAHHTLVEQLGCWVPAPESGVTHGSV